MALLTVSELKKYFGADLLFQGVSFQVDQGERVILVGRNGTGKTTLLRILMGLTDYDSGTVQFQPGCRVGCLSQDHLFTPGRTLYTEAESVFAYLHEWERHLRNLEKQMEVTEDAKELESIMEKYSRAIGRYEAMDGYTIGAQVKKVLFGLGFTEPELSIPAEALSGGQKVRLGLAKLLLEAPDLMLLDEPTNHLDLQAVEWLESYLQGIESAVIVVSHDRFFLDRIGMRTLELENHQAHLYSGNYTFAMEEKERRLTGEMDAYLRQQQEIKKLRSFYEKWRSTPSRKSQAMSRKKQLDKMEVLERPVTRHRSLKFSFQVDESSWTEVLTTKNLTFRYGENTIFANANLKVLKGDRIALIGGNGAGKTTFLKTIQGILSPSSGTVTWGKRVKIGYFSQDLEGLTEDHSCLEEILDLPGFTRPEAYNLLGQFLFSGEEAHKKIAACSGGEKNRLILAKLMVEGANVLILDEPTNHLDLESKAALEKALLAYPGTIIFVSHDRYFVDRIANKVWEFKAGQVVEYEGNYSAYRAEKERLAEIQAQSVGLAQRVCTEPAKSKQNQETKNEQKRIQLELRRLEAEIERLEEKKAVLELSLADPDVYKTDQGRQTVIEYQELLKSLSGLFGRWEKLVE